ncbi:2-hydroxymuconate semialdehyde hydrolase [Vibrio thalassae]|uniref:2-hydroxymuconate semialdehyde hydrolase n=1 Tax=Vibrio thalassae TaxID=1243014 RepID=A0A240EF76_9VIBR|nr:alpha/beta hydrolase [Vibrio thalassae]SNX47337.1 2-hydroxymuconate semialdehyde hydrolase [Vibrio thalassae]
MYNKVTLSNSESIAYIDRGQGTTLLLLHGNMTSSKHLEQFINTLPNNIRVIAPDMRGFGLSSYRKPIDSLSELSSDINELMQLLDIDSFAVAGWSMGGGVAMQMACDYPEKITHLILISSIGTAGYPLRANFGQGELLTSKEMICQDAAISTVVSAFKHKDKTFVKQLWDTAVYNHKKPEEFYYSQLIDDVLTQVNIDNVYYALSRFNISNKTNGIVDGNNLLTRLKAPALILHGESDLVIPLITAQQTNEELTTLGISIDIHECSDSGHSLFIDQPEYLCKKISDFLIG